MPSKFHRATAQIEAYIFQDCFILCLFLMSAFAFLSFLSCALPSETKKYRGTNLEIAVQSENYKWWLLISIVISIPSLLLRFLDLLRPWPTERTERLMHRNIFFSRSLEILVIAIPNCALYYCVAREYDTDFAWVANFQNALFYSQSSSIVGFIFCSTFGHKYKATGTDANLGSLVERSTVVFLAFFAIYKFFLLLSTILPSEPSAVLTCRIAAVTSLLIGIIVLSLIVFTFTRFLTRQINGFSFSDYNQLHDFLRMIGVIVYSCYTFTYYAVTGQISSGEALYKQNSESLILFLIGKIVLVIYLTVVDQHCALFEAKLKGDQLKRRLDLIRYISHELRSPLNSSFLGLQMMRESFDTIANTIKSIRTTILSNELSEPCESILESISRIMKERENFLETIDLVKESSNIALENLNDMLTFDKIDEKKLVLEVEDVDVWSFVSETVRPFRINAANDEVALTILQCPDNDSDRSKGWYIKADRFKLNQVLRNFVSNALKFSPKKTGIVQVLVERVVKTTIDEETERDFVRISVSDNGSGISMENQKSLFEQYVQFNASVLQKGGGSGLGLWISKNLIDLHGGLIGVKSEGEGKGATFFFELPLYYKSEELDGPEEVVESSSSDSDMLLRSSVLRPSSLKLFSSTPAASKETLAATAADGGKEEKDDEYPAVQRRLRSHPLTPTSVAISRFYRAIVTNSASPVAAKLFPTDDVVKEVDKEEERGLVGTNELIPKDAVKSETSMKAVESSDIQAFDEPIKNRPGDCTDKEIGTSDNTERGRKGKYFKFSCEGLRVLIVDDTSTTRKITRKMLMKVGFLVEEASDGLEFLRIMGFQSAVGQTMPLNSMSIQSNTTFDVILMDDNMPNMCGPDATAAVRAAGYKGLIFGVTGNTYDAQLDHFVASGADKVFTKPLNIKKLLEAIQAKFC